MAGHDFKNLFFEITFLLKLLVFNFIDVCKGYDCKNGGECFADKGTPKCDCLKNFEGDKCEKEKKKGKLVSYST